jgi:HSP90 family molecular chaperone
MEKKMQNFEDKGAELEKEVEKSTPIKEWLVEYVGNRFQNMHDEHRKEAKESGTEPQGWDGSVTVEMIVEAMAQEFPEFLMAIAEENWIRGYHQALTDVEEGEKLYKKEMESLENNGNDNEE